MHPTSDAHDCAFVFTLLYATYQRRVYASVSQRGQFLSVTFPVVSLWTESEREHETRRRPKLLFRTLSKIPELYQFKKM